MTRLVRIGAYGCVALCAATVFTPATAIAAPSTPPMTSVIVESGAVASDDGGSALAARKAAIAKALAIAADTYEGASAQVQAAAASYTQANAELPGAQEDLANANGSVIAASVGLDQANLAVTNAQAVVASATATVMADDHEVQVQRAAITSVVTAVYQGSAFLGLDSLLTSGSPGEVLNRFGYANEVVAAQKRTLDHYLAARKIAGEALNQSTVAARNADAALTTAATALTKSQQTKAAAAKAQEAVAALVAARKAALAVAQKNKAAVLAQYEQLQKENAQVVAELKAQAAADRAAAKKKAAEAKKKKSKSGGSQSNPPPSSGTTGRSGYDLMPIHGWMSSPFGMRFDPIYKRWQLHAGVDIAAPTGTSIHAARAGRVIRAGWYGGYGNYTCIDTGLYQGKGADHGRDIANCYAHQSRILVHVGEHISLGQVIGKVGMTGAATGPHLHFEVRVDGTPVQPLNWLPKCFCGPL